MTFSPDLCLLPLVSVYLYFFKVSFPLASSRSGYPHLRHLLLSPTVLPHPQRGKYPKTHFSSLSSLYLYSFTELMDITATSGPRLPSPSWKLPHVLVYHFYTIPLSMSFTLEGQYYQPTTIIMPPTRVCSYAHLEIIAINLSKSWEHSKSLKITEWSLYQIAHFYRPMDWSEFWHLTTKEQLFQKSYSSSDA